jgi:hypothetical protein
VHAGGSAAADSSMIVVGRLLHLHASGLRRFVKCRVSDDSVLERIPLNGIALLAGSGTAY